MDPRRLSTAEVLALGITSMPAPEIDEPEDREEVSLWIEDVEGGNVATLLDEGKIVGCSEYYGIPIAWKKDGGGYRGVLLQYREITEKHDFEAAQEAAAWFVETARAVAG